MTEKGKILDREEYIEQAHMFRAMSDRVNPSQPVQELLLMLKQEILVTTRLPMAIDYLLAELNHAGTMSTAMQRLGHYFTPFQTFLIAMAEADVGRFDMQRATTILAREATFRADGGSPAGMFFYQFEALSRNRLSYDTGLSAMSGDAIYDEMWSQWILDIRHRLGLVDLADLIYVHSEFARQRGNVDTADGKTAVILFGEREGRIALANRRREPLYFFAALQRQLNYPKIPEPPKPDVATVTIPKILRQLEKMEVRLKLLEDEQREKGIDLSKFYGRPAEPGE